MNRIPHVEADGSVAPSTTSSSAGQVDQALSQLGSHHGLHHALFGPLHYEKNYAYPLLVWLHGAEENERQLQRIMPFISVRNYIAIGMRGTSSAEGGYTWTDSPAGVAQAEQRVFAGIEIVQQKLNVASHRIFLAGSGIGGTMAFRIGALHPERFAGALSLGGPFPRGDSPLRQLGRLRQLPLFIAQGRNSRDYPVERSCDELRLFHSAGMSVTLRQYPCGDEIDPRMLHDMDVWMMELVTGQSQQDTNWSLGDIN